MSAHAGEAARVREADVEECNRRRRVYAAITTDGEPHARCHRQMSRQPSSALWAAQCHGRWGGAR